MRRAARAVAGWAAAGLLLLAAACGPTRRDLERGEAARVVKVVDGDTVELDTGLRVHLVSLEAPRDRVWGAKARQALERLTLQRQVELRYGGLKRAPASKRYAQESALAHLYAKTEGGRWVWVQEGMLRQGLARVHSHKDNLARVPQLLRLEADARARKHGLWSDAQFAVREAEEAAEARGFVLVEGVVRTVARAQDRLYLNFGDAAGKDFAVVIEAEDAPAFAALEPESLRDQRVRVRGYVRNKGAPLMQADHPAQLELAPRPSGA